MNNTKPSIKIDLRNQVNNHCIQCTHFDTSMCSGCFFASVDFKTPELGGREQYARAFDYLRVANVKGFKRDRPFGNYMEIKRKELVQ